MQDDTIIFISNLIAHSFSMTFVMIILQLYAIDLCYYKNSYVRIHTYQVIQFLVSSFQLSLTYVIPIEPTICKFKCFILILVPEISTMRHQFQLTGLFSIIVICKFFFIQVLSEDGAGVRQLSFKNVILFSVGIPLALTVPYNVLYYESQLLRICGRNTYSIQFKP